MIPQITVHLLDSALGHRLQSWSFETLDAVTVGRSPDNDVILADPYVSRAHAFLQFDNNQWKFIAISRQLIVHEGQSLPEVLISDGTVCRLGPNGCYLRFGQPETQQNHRATILFDATLMPVLQLDRETLEDDVNQIVDAPYFQQLKAAMRQRREQRQRGET